MVVLPSKEAVASRAADIVSRLLAARPDAVLGLPTGETPRPFYAELVRRHRAGTLSFARATTFNLDEYVGLPAGHPAAFRRYMQQALFRHVDVDPAHTHVPDGAAIDVAAACAAYEAALASAGGLDLVVLGVGLDGHVAFNEPTSSFASRTRLKTLSDPTRASQASAFPGEDVPRHAITLGLGNILEARHCLLLASGAHKAPIVARLCEGPLTALVPASALQLHRRATVLLDEEAARDLSLRDYYDLVQRHKPAWQN